MSNPKPKLPQPQPVILQAGTCAVLVLDGSTRWGNPKLPCYKMAPGVGKLLDRARGCGIPIAYTVSFAKKGTPEGEVFSGLNPQPNEPVFYPDAFDKFNGGELHDFLSNKNVSTVIITGYRSNICVLHTAITAARVLDYKVIIPMDGMAALSDYEQEYTFIHLAVMPAQAAEKIFFTMLDMIEFSDMSPSLR